MSFKNPGYLLLIIVAGLFYYLKIKQKPVTVKYSLAGYLMKTVRENKIKKNIGCILRTAAIVFFIIALARPQLGLKERDVIKPAVDIMIVMDVSTSMRAIDFKPDNRMEAAVKAAKEFVKERASDRMGVVVFSGLALLHAPLTMDSNAIIRLMDNIEAGMIDVDGTAIGEGISLGLKYLNNSDSPSKIMVLLTDGANNAGDIAPETAAEMAAALDVKIYTIGAGRPGPAQVPVDHPHFGRRLVTIADEIDEETLRGIARKTGGRYFRATSLKEFKSIYAEIDKMEKQNIEVSEYYEYEEYFYFFLYAGLLIIAAELAIRMTKPGIFR